MTATQYLVGVASLALLAQLARLLLAWLDYRKRYRKRRTS